MNEPCGKLAVGKFTMASGWSCKMCEEHAADTLAAFREQKLAEFSYERFAYSFGTCDVRGEYKCTQ